MSCLRLLLACVALTATFCGAAQAADMPGTRPVPLPPPITPAPTFIERITSGWYLRGDLGERWGTLSGTSPTAPFPGTTSDKLGTAVVGTLGVGIKSEWIRTDVTVDLAGAQKYTGTIATQDDTTAKIQTTSVLFNGYLDLGTWYGFTPYVGAGAGGSNVKVSDYSSTLSPPFNGASSTKWKFTWAAMAGLGWQVAPNMMLDFGYRYLNFGDVSTGSDAFGEMTFRNVAAHEVRVGVRWSFDDIRRR